MRAVMYHYVRPHNDEYYYLDLDDFRRQLDYFADQFNLIERKTFLSYLNGDDNPSSEDILLTFDDGLSDHHEWVLPELQKRGLWGLFYIPGPIQDTLLPVHRIHSMLGSAASEDLAGRLREIIEELDLRDQESNRFDQIYTNRDSNRDTQWFKRMLNFLVPYQYLDRILDELETRVSGVDQINPTEFYMTQDQLVELADARMLLGGHTVSHPVLSRLSQKAQRSEITRSLEFIRDLADQPICTFAYPYGGEEMYTETTVEILQNVNCHFAFTSEAAEISHDTLRRKPLRLPRYDCNEFEYGTASLI